MDFFPFPESSVNNVDQYLKMINELIAIANDNTLLAMIVSICVSLFISLVIYIRCHTRPGHPALQFFSFMIAPIFVFFLTAYILIRPLTQECETNDANDSMVSVECIESSVLDSIKKSQLVESDPVQKGIVERFVYFKRNKLFISIMNIKYLTIALCFCFFYPWFLLFYTRRRVHN